MRTDSIFFFFQMSRATVYTQVIQPS
jgi:hypothetical protein